ncbi:MAG: hypothetical protein ACX932_04535 [Gammaproteobacteria bacterium]
MWQAIKTAAGTVWVYIKKVPSALKAAPRILDSVIRMGLGSVSQLVTEGLKVQEVSRAWNTWREHLLYGGMSREDSDKEPLSHATYSAASKPNTASLVDQTYKAGVISLLGALSIGLVLLAGPIAIIPLGATLAGATLLRFAGYMDPKLYKMLATGLMAGLMVAGLMGLAVLFPPLLALPVVGSAFALMTGTTGLLISLGLMTGMALLSTGISGLLDDGFAGIGRAIVNLLVFPLNVAAYSLSAMASFAWDMVWWPFHGFYNMYDKGRNKIRENWPIFKEAISGRWKSLQAAVSNKWNNFKTAVKEFALRIKGQLSSPKTELIAEIDDTLNEDKKTVDADVSRDNESEFEFEDDVSEDSDSDLEMSNRPKWSFIESIKNYFSNSQENDDELILDASEVDIQELDSQPLLLSDREQPSSKNKSQQPDKTVERTVEQQKQDAGKTKVKGFSSLLQWFRGSNSETSLKKRAEQGARNFTRSAEGRELDLDPTDVSSFKGHSNNF